MIKMKENMLMVTLEYSSIEARCERIPMEWTINIIKNESVILGIQIRPLQIKKLIITFMIHLQISKFPLMFFVFKVKSK